MFADLFTIENLTTFLILTALETVLGFDNLLYISVEAKRVGAASEAHVRRVGTLNPCTFESTSCGSWFKWSRAASTTSLIRRSATAC